MEFSSTFKIYTLTSCQDVQANILMQSLQFLRSAKAMYFPSAVKSRPRAKFGKDRKTTIDIDLPAKYCQSPDYGLDT